jgi:predicted Zn-dependent protease
MEAAHYNYELANGIRPTPYSLANAGNIYIWENKIFEAIREYQRANRLLKGESILENNLGFAYAKVHNLDSALTYLNSARDNSFTKTSAETNFFAGCARTNSAKDRFRHSAIRCYCSIRPWKCAGTFNIAAAGIQNRSSTPRRQKT